MAESQIDSKFYSQIDSKLKQIGKSQIDSKLTANWRQKVKLTNSQKKSKSKLKGKGQIDSKLTAKSQIDSKKWNYKLKAAANWQQKVKLTAYCHHFSNWWQKRQIDSQKANWQQKVKLTVDRCWKVKLTANLWEEVKLTAKKIKLTANWQQKYQIDSKMVCHHFLMAKRQIDGKLTNLMLSLMTSTSYSPTLLLLYSLTPPTLLLPHSPTDLLLTPLLPHSLTPPFLTPLLH